MTAAETAAPPASTSRIADASIEAKISAAESARRVCVRRGAAAAAVGGTCCGWGVGDLPLPLPLLALKLELELVLALALVLVLLPRPTARSIKLSTVAAALLLSFAALPLTAWIWVRFFRVVGDCRTRSVREGCAGGGGGLPRP